MWIFNKYFVNVAECISFSDELPEDLCPYMYFSFKMLNLLLVTLFVKFLTPQATFTSQQLPSQVTLFP